MTMPPYYASAEQVMRDRSELARKGIARGRSVIALICAEGVLLVAENRSQALHKLSEIYDRIGFAAVGKYNEFENLRRAGITHADMRGYTYDRRDVTGRSLANAYAQTLGTIFTDQAKPYEVELCVAEVPRPDDDGATAALYRIGYDGSIVDEPDFVVMGGATEPIVSALRASYRPGLDFGAALRIAVDALQASAEDAATEQNPAPPQRRRVGVEALEVAALETARTRRAFRRLTTAQVRVLLDESAGQHEQGPAAGRAED